MSALVVQLAPLLLIAVLILRERRPRTQTFCLLAFLTVVAGVFVLGDLRQHLLAAVCGALALLIGIVYIVLNVRAKSGTA